MKVCLASSELNTPHLEAGSTSAVVYQNKTLVGTLDVDGMGRWHAPPGSPDCIDSTT